VNVSTGLGISAPSVVTGKTAALSVVNGGTNTSTTFGWSVSVKPTGATTPTFSVNNSNSAKNTTVTFKNAGSYTIKLTSTTGTTVKTATVMITVNQTLTSVAISPTTATVRWGRTQQFSGTPKDQFGAAMTTAVTWAIDAGGAGGTVSTSGLYTAPTSGSGTTKVRVTAGSFSAVSTVTIPSFTSSKVNFQPSSAATVTGYIVDGGATFAVRNSQMYGWSVSETDAAVDRAKNSNQLLDTNIGIKSGAKWEMAVPNGTYSVKVSVGDGATATTNTIRLEGTTVFNAVKLNANTYSNKTVTVTVSDNKLTLDAGAAASLVTRVDFIEITKTA
jgi:hypothetical protein